jgi:hypothetical protein
MVVLNTWKANEKMKGGVAQCGMSRQPAHAADRLIENLFADELLFSAHLVLFGVTAKPGGG